MHVPNLRSCHEKTGGIVYFGRMIDKIRLHAAGELPAEYHENLGGGFDERCLKFLRVDYPALVERVKKGGTDEEFLAWAMERGGKRGDEEIEVWNEFMRKRGWNDAMSERLKFRLEELGCPERTDIQTFFDFIDLDEGRDPRLRQRTG
jgi:gluconokinase